MTVKQKCINAPFTRYNRLSNRLYNRLDKQLHRVNTYPTGCQQTGLTTGWMFVYTIQPVVQPVVKAVWQPVVSCIQTVNRLSNRFDNRLDHRLHRVNGV